MAITVCGFSCNVPLISVRFPKNWNVSTNFGENPQQTFKKISPENAGLFYADIRTEGQLLSTPGYSMRTSGRTDMTNLSLFGNCCRRLSKMFLIIITHNIIHF
jgi:hypothetical protein